LPTSHKELRGSKITWMKLLSGDVFRLRRLSVGETLLIDFIEFAARIVEYGCLWVAQPDFPIWVMLDDLCEQAASRTCFSLVETIFLDSTNSMRSFVTLLVKLLLCFQAFHWGSKIKCTLDAFLWAPYLEQFILFRNQITQINVD
jgi:hypothetical protein